jgi:cytochrome c peroxidase
VCVFTGVSFTRDDGEAGLRKIYSQSPERWPAPGVNAGIDWKELGPQPSSPFIGIDSLRAKQQLGAILFFDNRLSGSGKISCATCHVPELSWTDARERSVGHEGAFTKRNSPTIQNVWFQQKLFWEGRSRDLEDQAFGPINSDSEMHGDMPGLPRRLRRITSYAPLFAAAFGDEEIDPDRITIALAAFQRTIEGAPTRFDRFLAGERNALTKSELRGLHLFRTKARCMNCHHGPMFTDLDFHHNGFSGNDVGRFFVTHQEKDKGKLKTPSLRNVAFTGPWMHDGSVKDLEEIIRRYNQPSEPGRDPVLQPLGLTRLEIRDLVAFLRAISAPPLPFEKPGMPK